MGEVISMLRAIEQLVSGERTKVDNHSKKFLMNNPDWEDFKTDTGDRFTSSTIKVINDYRKYFKELGYNDLNESEK